MPTRFPAGINAGLKHNTPLHDILSTNADAGQWGLYYNDFTSTAGFTALPLSTGTCSITTANNNNAGEFGQLNCLTAATGNDLQVAYLSSFAANTPATPFYYSNGATVNNTAEFVLSTRIKLSNAAMGFWIGLISSGDIYAAGPVDLSADTSPVVSHGIYFHKAISTTSIYFDMLGAAAAAMVTQTAVNTAVSTTTIGLIAHMRNDVMRLYQSTQAANAAPVWTKVAEKTVTGTTSTSTGALGLVIGAKAETTSTRTLSVDNVLWAHRSPIGR